MAVCAGLVGGIVPTSSTQDVDDTIIRRPVGCSLLSLIHAFWGEGRGGGEVPAFVVFRKENYGV